MMRTPWQVEALDKIKQWLTFKPIKIPCVPTVAKLAPAKSVVQSMPDVPVLSCSTCDQKGMFDFISVGIADV